MAVGMTTNKNDTNVTLAPIKECEGNAFGYVCLSICLSGCITQKHCSDLLDFVTQEVLYPWLGPPLRSSGSRSGSGLENIFKDFSPLGDRNKICHRMICVMMKTCIMTSYVHHSERGSVISDCSAP